MAKKKTADQPADMSLYNPSEADQQLLAEWENKFDQAINQRRPHEGQWYLNAAFIRGQQWVEWDDHRRVLSVEAAPQRRIRRTFNLILPKVRARQAKFQKNRPRPEVKPATTDIKDILDARMTTKVLDFNWRALGLEQAYVSALGWSMRTGHGYWWFRWDDQLQARIRLQDEATGETQVQEGVVGDVSVEVSGPFETVVGDPNIEHIGRQPWIGRERLRDLSWIAQRYENGKFVQPDADTDNGMGYDKQIGQLSPTNQLGVGVTSAPSSSDSQPKKAKVREVFQGPCAKYPKGRQIAFANGVLLRQTGELPYQMWDMRFNPYPVVDFTDLDMPGQYWGPTVVEQLVGPQRQYNRIRSRLEEHLRLLMGGKLLVARQHNIPKTAWSCVDTSTEILTDKGWQNHETLQVGDLIWAFDPKTNTCRWQPCQAVHCYDVENEPLHRLTARGLDALVTSNHMWEVQLDKSDRAKQRRRVSTEELLTLPRSGWQIPTARPGELPITTADPEYFELLGWIAAEGCFTDLGAIQISQTKPAGRTRIRQLLDAVGVKYTEQPRYFYIWKDDAQTIRNEMPEKLLRWDIIATTSEVNLRAFLQGMVGGDGTIKANGSVTLHSSDLAVCDRAIAIGQMLGIHTNLYKVRDSAPKCFPAPYGNKVYQCKAQYRVNLGGPAGENKSTRITSLHTTLERYTGVVWCPTVETGAVLYRRNGTTYISGQSGIGEMIEYQAHPNIPPPQIWTPPPVVSDTWRVLERLTLEIDTISQIYPEAEGRVGNATSGFQTNLLQEATDAVHAPDIRRHERAIEEAAWKVRRLMKLLYTVPRLISITSTDDQTEAFEFSQADIDDHADVVVQAGSGLPDLKGAKIQMALELRNSGIFGDPADPEVNRKVLSMLDMGDLGTVYASARRDEERARLENIDFEEGRVPDPPLFCDNHDIHSRNHTDLLKSPSTKSWDPEIFNQFIDHILWHAVYVNPQAAAQIAAIYGRPIPQLPTVQPPAAPQPQPQQPQMPQQDPGMMPPEVAAQMQAQMAPPSADPMAAASGANQMNPEFGFGPQGGNTMMPM